MSREEQSRASRGQAPFWLVLLIYNLLSPLLFLAMLPGWFKRARARGRWNERFGERLGLPDAELRDWCRAHRPVWIHAVSVGEGGLALRLLGCWLERDPEARFVVTTTTATGRGVLESGLERMDPGAAARVRFCWAPFDLAPCAWLGVRSLAPSRLVLTEGDWWPNWIARAGARGARVDLFHARMSPRSARRVAKFAWLVGPIFRRLGWIGLQREEDRAGFAAIGVDPDRLEVTGSVKYDRQRASLPDPEQIEAFGAMLERLPGDADTPVVMSVSTFAGEEEMIARTCRTLASRDGLSTRLVLVPRHAERGAVIAAQLEAAGWRVWQRSLVEEWPPPSREQDERPELLLVDSTGELRAWLELATVAVIGKSWKPGERTGQNPVEPLEAGAAVICGPWMANFRALVAELVEAGGLVQVPLPDEAVGSSLEQGLESDLRQMLLNPGPTRGSIERGRACLERHQGATQRTVEGLRSRW